MVDLKLKIAQIKYMIALKLKNNAHSIYDRFKGQKHNLKIKKAILIKK